MFYTHSKYSLTFCEIHHPYYHGKDINSTPNIETHFLCIVSYSYNNYFEAATNQEQEYVPETPTDFIQSYNVMQSEFRNRFSFQVLRRHRISTWPPVTYMVPTIIYRVRPHPVIRNYKKIARLQLEIADVVVLDGGESVCILKTFWIRIFQRKWKKYCAVKKQRLQFARNPWSFIYMEIMGVKNSTAATAAAAVKKTVFH